jgi:hypothetical protein
MVAGEKQANGWRWNDDGEVTPQDSQEIPLKRSTSIEMAACKAVHLAEVQVQTLNPKPETQHPRNTKPL